MAQMLKELMSVNGLMLLIVLVALGLSITAVVRGCPDKFGDVCGRIKNNTLDTKGCTKGGNTVRCKDYNDCDQLPGLPDPIDKTPTYDCECYPDPGPSPSPTGKCVETGNECNLTKDCCDYDPGDKNTITCNNRGGTEFIKKRCQTPLTKPSPTPPPHHHPHHHPPTPPPPPFMPGPVMPQPVIGKNSLNQQESSSSGTQKQQKQKQKQLNNKHKGNESLIIILSSVGGVLLLAVVVYLLMRKRKNRVM